MNIIVTNDDGIHAAGIRALAEAMTELGTVTVVAPDRERSAVGHSLTLHSPLRVLSCTRGGMPLMAPRLIVSTWVFTICCQSLPT